MKKLIWILVLALTLSGCSLAAAGGEGPSGTDTLVGMLVTLTRDGEDVWDGEAAGMTAIHRFENEGKRLYAEAYEKDGMPSYRFPAGCGLACFEFPVEPEEGEDYMAYVTDPELSDVHRFYRVGEGTDTDATIYAPKNCGISAYLNPVYRTPDGEIYALGTSPMGADLGSMDGCSRTLRQEVARDGTTTDDSSVTLRYEHISAGTAYRLLEMDADHALVRELTFAGSNAPEAHTPDARTAYILLETEDSRQVYSRGDEEVRMGILTPGRFGLYQIAYTTIQWEG